MGGLAQLWPFESLSERLQHLKDLYEICARVLQTIVMLTWIASHHFVCLLARLQASCLYKRDYARYIARTRVPLRLVHPVAFISSLRSAFDPSCQLTELSCVSQRQLRQTLADRLRESGEDGVPPARDQTVEPDSKDENK